MNYETMTDSELSEAVALKCARWHKSSPPGVWWNERGTWAEYGPDFATSADAVLPVVKAHLASCLFSGRKAFWESMRGTTDAGDTVQLDASLTMHIAGEILARKFCLALLKAADSAKGGAS